MNEWPNDWMNSFRAECEKGWNEMNKVLGGLCAHLG